MLLRGGAPLLGCRGHRRNSPIRRIVDQRGAIVELSVDNPEGIVVARRDVSRLEALLLAENILQRGQVPGVSKGRVTVSVEKLGRGPLQVRQLLVGQKCAAGQFLRSLQGSRAVVRPHPGQIRMTVGGLGRRPRLLGT